MRLDLREAYLTLTLTIFVDDPDTSIKTPVQESKEAASQVRCVATHTQAGVRVPLCAFISRFCVECYVFISSDQWVPFSSHSLFGQPVSVHDGEMES
jgi:hypothetical protein